MKILERILDLLFPRRCAFCHKLMETEGQICRDCGRKLPCTMGEGQRVRLREADCYAALYYEGDVRESLLRYKFRAARGYAKVYAEFLTKCVDENRISCDSITWTPLSRRRLRRRGYDQAELLARELSRRLELPCVRTLVKLRNNPAQSLTGDAARRRANVAGAYAAFDEGEIRGKRLLLVDDIVTTGATLSECVKVLKQAGAAEVSCLTVARKRG